MPKNEALSRRETGETPRAPETKKPTAEDRRKSHLRVVSLEETEAQEKASAIGKIAPEIRNNRSEKTDKRAQRIADEYFALVAERKATKDASLDGKINLLERQLDGAVDE